MWYLSMTDGSSVIRELFSFKAKQVFEKGPVCPISFIQQIQCLLKGVEKIFQIFYVLKVH